MSTGDYDRQYAKTEALFGREPEPILTRYVDRLEPGARILDVGAGQGRNALFLARRGFTVHALEPSAVAAAALKETADRESLPVERFPDRFECFDPPVKDYAGILVFGLIPDLDRPAIGKLAGKIDGWSRSGSLVWLTGFTTRDPSYARHAAAGTTLGKNSFRSPEGRVRTYLEPDEILALFDGYTVLHHHEGPGPRHRHGDGPIERHALFEAVLARAETTA